MIFGRWTESEERLQFKIHILTLTGEKLGSFAPDPDPGFGVRCVAWQPGGAYLAVGGWEDKVCECTLVTGTI